jgi:endonuclease IV
MTPDEIKDNLIALGDNEYKAKILLETPACSPATAVYNTASNLKELLAVIERNGLTTKFAICIDTAHLNAMGTPLSTRDNMKAFLKNFSNMHGIRRKIIFHLNDDQNPLGHGKDEHTCLTHGMIWKSLDTTVSGLGKLIKFIKKHKCIAIFEGKTFSDYRCNCNVKDVFLHVA